MMVGATRGVFTALERMGKSKGGKGGRVVNTCSIAGLLVSLFPCIWCISSPKLDLYIQIDEGPIEGVGYSLAKHGMVTLTRSFAVSEYGTSIVARLAQNSYHFCIYLLGLCPWFANTKLVR